MFLGRKIIFICENESTIDSGWPVVLSRNKITFLCSNNSSLLNRCSTASITSDIIHDSRLEKQCTLAGNDGTLAPLKHKTNWHCFLPCNNCLFDFFTSSINKKAIVNLCFDFFPPFSCLPFSTNPLSVITLKDQPDLSMFQIFLMNTLRSIPVVFSSKK